MCISTHVESNKIDFFILWIFCDLLWFFKDSAELNLCGYCSKPVVTVVNPWLLYQNPIDKTAKELNLRGFKNWGACLSGFGDERPKADFHDSLGTKSRLFPWLKRGETRRWAPFGWALNLLWLKKKAESQSKGCKLDLNPCLPYSLTDWGINILITSANDSRSLKQPPK
jgi:hypothetical protein